MMRGATIYTILVKCSDGFNRLILKSNENIYLDILLSIFKAVVDTLYETSGHRILESNENDVRAACFATRPEPSGWRGQIEDVR